MHTIKSPTLYVLSAFAIAAMLLFFLAYGFAYLFRHPVEFARRVWQEDRLIVIALVLAIAATCFGGCATANTITIPAPPPVELEPAP
ncbi:hypothetical protein [Actomonas aquatica]|uniref:Uncharacterized protein n=1 Tax=Actomonas aquatica TaxID=2866162 RepID=A0ABZ1CCV2_9BACT|nr:hypothetical protein [Opitutus sp. WL0086]WRQ89374.1 hypothetical protein K1X11_008130 [Opitutus sp. WL0086]